MHYSYVTNPADRPAELYHIKATGRTKINAVHANVHKSFSMWVKDSKNPFVHGLFSEDLSERFS
jgi:hypothetical protein